jgi:cytochrome d ubiquinol oxidase subunit II
MMDVLPLIWAAFLTSAIVFYVLLDGFSLGIGILFPFARTGHDRDLMMATIVPVWDGNQTWLVGGGMALLTAFPKAANLLATAFYLPLTIMVLALVFRGAGLEFRFKAKVTRLWSVAFVAGSIVAAFSQGMVLGTYVQGFEYDGTRLLGGVLAFISPFSLFTGLCVVLAYAMLGACWLIYKTEGELQQWAQAAARRLLPMVVAAVGLISLWSALAIPYVRDLWFGWPNIILLSPIPFWTLVLSAVLYRLLYKLPRQDFLPFLCCIGLYLMTLIGLGISLWPYVVPRTLTIWQVAAPDSSLLFAMVGVLLIVPVILVYTAHSYYVFRGKVSLRDVYH